jgi:lactate dehydrogenase-like 2-hydroxyacid dehydrogenase
VSADELSAMKSNTIFINISREPLINESALIDALLKNGIAGAGA